MRLIELLYGSPAAEPWGAFYDPIYNGELEPPTTTQIVVSTNDGSHLVFKGSFTVVGGDVTGGTMTGFVGLEGSTKMLEGNGFDIDGAALFDALQTFEANSDPFFDLLFGAAIKTIGTKLGDQVEGTEFGDTIIGKAGDDDLFGWLGDDLIKGGKGNDAIQGAEGFDRLYGGAGDDAFRFDLDPLEPPVGFDKVKDFKVGEDLFTLRTYVEGLTPGVLDAAYFHKGTEATTGQQIVIYDKSTGRLFFDVDGSGIEAQFLFAKVTPGTKLGAGDFFVSNSILM